MARIELLAQMNESSRSGARRKSDQQNIFNLKMKTDFPLLVKSFGNFEFKMKTFFNSQNCFLLNYFKITKVCLNLLRGTLYHSSMTSLKHWKIRTWYSLKVLKRRYLPQYNRRDIRSLIFIKIRPTLAEIKSQKKAINIDHKGDIGKPDASLGSSFRKYGRK